MALIPNEAEFHEMQILTPVLLPRGYVDWVHPWRSAEGKPAYMYGEEFNTPYCPVIFEQTK